MLDVIVFCAIIIGIINGLGKIKATSESSYRSCNSLLDFLFINDNK